MAGRALSWAVMACTLAHAAKVDNLYASRRSLSRMLQGYERDFEGAIKRASKRREPEEEPLAIDDLAEDIDDQTPDVLDRDGSIIVFTSVGNDATSEGKRVVKEFETFVRRRLPLPGTPDLAAVRTRLTTEFPWAISIADEMLKRLVGRNQCVCGQSSCSGSPDAARPAFRGE